MKPRSAPLQPRTTPNQPRNTRITQILALAALAAGVAADAHAQPAARSRFELSIGALWTGGYSLGRGRATETRNQTDGDRFVLFDARGTATSGAGAEARLTFNVTPRVALEAGAAAAATSIATRLSGDAESAPDVTASEDVTEYIVDGAVMINLPRIRSMMPFVRAGVGYLRQLHDHASLVEDGRVFHAGGGVSFWLSSRRWSFIDAWGLRADARVLVREGAFTFDDDQRTGAAATVALVLGF